MKEQNHYESPQMEFHEIQSEGPLCWSGMEELGEDKGNWG